MLTNQNNPINLTVIGHLEELRKRIFYVLGYLTAGMIAGLYLTKYFIRLLEVPANASVHDFIVLQPTDIVNVYFKVSLYLGIIVASPAIIYNIWRYVKPALPEGSRVSITSWSISSCLLFCLGTVFSYKILLPAAYQFLYSLSKEVASPAITLDSYLSFALTIIVIGGSIFEMPVLTALLTRLRLVTPMLLRSKRREAIFILCVIAAVVTPTTDAFNMIIFVLPMIALFEVSVIVSSFVYKIYVKDSKGEPYGY